MDNHIGIADGLGSRALQMIRIIMAGLNHTQPATGTAIHRCAHTGHLCGQFCNHPAVGLRRITIDDTGANIALDDLMLKAAPSGG